MRSDKCDVTIPTSANSDPLDVLLIQEKSMQSLWNTGNISDFFLAISEHTYSVTVIILKTAHLFVLLLSLIPGFFY